MAFNDTSVFLRVSRHKFILVVVLKVLRAIYESVLRERQVSRRHFSDQMGGGAGVRMHKRAVRIISCPLNDHRQEEDFSGIIKVLTVLPLQRLEAVDIKANSRVTAILGELVAYIASYQNMALNGVHPESSSLPSTFVPAERSGVDDDWTELRDKQQRPHSSYNPSEEQKRRSRTEDGPDQSQNNMQVLVNAAGSSTEGLSSNSTHQNGGVNRIGEISEETEPAPKPIVKKKKRKLLLYLADKIAGLLILSIVIAGLFSIPVALFALKPNVRNQLTP